MSQKFLPQTDSAKCHLLRLYFHIFILSYHIGKHAEGNMRETSLKLHKKMSLGRPRMSILNLSYKYISVTLFSILFHQICALKTKDIVVVLTFLKKPPKDVLRVVVAHWRQFRTYFTKHISEVILSVLIYQTCVLNTNKLVIVYSFSFRKTSSECS